jgi:hypothetical protein
MKERFDQSSPGLLRNLASRSPSAQQLQLHTPKRAAQTEARERERKLMLMLRSFRGESATRSRYQTRRGSSAVGKNNRNRRQDREQQEAWVSEGRSRHEQRAKREDGHCNAGESRCYAATCNRSIVFHSSRSAVVVPVAAGVTLCEQHAGAAGFGGFARVRGRRRRLACTDLLLSCETGSVAAAGDCRATKPRVRTAVGLSRQVGRRWHEASSRRRCIKRRGYTVLGAEELGRARMGASDAVEL